VSDRQTPPTTVLEDTLRISLILASTLLLITACRDDSCGNTVLQDVPSPDGRWHAVVFARNCGATTGFSTQVSLLNGSRTATGSGNVFVADSDHGKVPSGPGGGPVVLANWIDARTLRIRYDTGARVFRQDTRHDDLKLQYLAEAEHQR
jgi:hypothetical protein